MKAMVARTTLGLALGVMAGLAAGDPGAPAVAAPVPQARHATQIVQQDVKLHPSVPTSRDRAPYSKTHDLCTGYSGSGVATLVTKGTSCDFGADVLDSYEANAPRGDRARARRTVTFTAYSAATHKTYAVKCAPQRYTRDANGWRYRVVSCRTGQKFRANVQGWYRQH